MTIRPTFVLAVACAFIVAGCADTSEKTASTLGAKISFDLRRAPPSQALAQIEDLAKARSHGHLEIVWLGSDQSTSPHAAMLEPTVTFHASDISVSNAIAITADLIGAKVIHRGDTIFVLPTDDPNLGTLMHIDWFRPPDWPSITWPPVYMGPVVVRGTCRSSVTKAPIQDFSVKPEYGKENYTSASSVVGNGEFQTVVMVPWSAPSVTIGTEHLRLLPAPCSNTCPILIEATGFKPYRANIFITETNFLYVLDAELTPERDKESDVGATTR